MSNPIDPQPPEPEKDPVNAGGNETNDPFAWAIDQLEKMRNGQFDVNSIKDMVETAKEKMGSFFNRS